MKKIFNTIYKLKRIKRTGWGMVGVTDSETVAEHTFGVATLAILFADKFKCDSRKLIQMAIIHDFGESIVGDIVTDIGKKEVYSKEEKKKLENNAVENILKGKDELLEIFKEFITAFSLEARIVHQLDKLEMMLQAFEYEKHGDTTKEKVQEFWDYADDFFKGKELEKIYLELKSEREKL